MYAYMHELKLSIIVPIYNVEQYLRKCVESLLTQDLDPAEYEIILVDDGSPDGCPAICDEYATLSETNQQSSIAETASNYQPVMPRIKVIHQPNGGLSDARNSGLKVTEGKYVQFVDSDDYLQPNVLRGLVEQMERENLDVLRFDYRNVNELGQEIHPNKNPKQYSDYSEKVCSGEEFLNNRLGFACYAPMFILRRSIIIGDNADSADRLVLFAQGVYFEDTDWTPRMLLQAKRVASSRTVVYNYLWRVGSITLAVEKAKKKKILKDKIRLLGVFSGLQQDVQDNSWFRWQTTAIVMSILGVITKDFYKERKEYIHQLKRVVMLPLSLIRTNRNQRLKIRIANLSMNLYCTVAHCLYR